MMTIKKIIFDARWLNSGGIGRFCQEMMQSSSLDKAVFLSGDVSQALSIKDPFLLAMKLIRGGLFVSPGYNAPILLSSKSVITVHDLMHLNFNEYNSFKSKLYYNYIVKYAIRAAPLVFTVSEFSRSEISSWAGVSERKIEVVPNGVDHNTYHLNVEPILRKKPYFFYVGNNKPHKNLKRVIESFSLSGLSESFDFVLSCHETECLSDFINDLNLNESVIFLNGIEEKLLPKYYKGAYACVVASLYEGFCLPILESMAVGTPVITSNITAMPDTAKGAALLVNPYDVFSIKDAMLRLSTDSILYDDLSKKGVLRAANFSWEISRDIWDQALNKIIEKS